MARRPRRAQGRPLPSGVVVAVVVLVGLAPAMILPSGLNPTLPGKVAATAVGLLLVLRQVDALHVPRARTAQLAAGLLLVWLTIAALASAAPLTSVLGAPTRFLGLVAWIGFGLAAAGGAALAARWGEVPLLHLAARATAIPIGLGAVLAAAELLGAPLLDIALEFEGRAAGLFANPGLTAAHLALAIPLVAGAAVGDRDWRWLHTASAVLGIATLLATQTRAVMVALAAVGGILLVVRWRQQRGAGSTAGEDGQAPAGATRRVLVAGAAIAVVAALGAGLVAAGRWQGAGGSLGGRLDTWEVAARVIVERPVLGTGPEGFGAAFVTQVDEEFVTTWTRGQLTDRAHDVVLDVTAVGGLPAGIAHLVLVGCVGVLLWRRRRDAPVVVGAAGGVAAMLVQQLVLFPQPVHDSLLWFVVGLLAVGHTRPLPRWTRRAGVLAATGLVAWGLLGVAADLQVGASMRQEGPEAVRTAMGVVDLQPVGDLPGLVIADRALLVRDPGVLAAAEQAVAEVEQRAFPTGLSRLARVDLLLARHRAAPGGDDLPVSLGLLCELLERDTTNGDAWLKLGVVAHEQDQPAAAAAAWQRAEVLLPGRDEPSENLEVLGDVTAAGAPDAACG